MIVVTFQSISVVSAEIMCNNFVTGINDTTTTTIFFNK